MMWDLNQNKRYLLSQSNDLPWPDIQIPWSSIINTHKSLLSPSIGLSVPFQLQRVHLMTLCPLLLLLYGFILTERRPQAIGGLWIYMWYASICVSLYPETGSCPRGHPAPSGDFRALYIPTHCCVGLLLYDSGQKMNFGILQWHKQLMANS